MRKYSAKRAKRGKLAFKTPSPVRYKLILRANSLQRRSKISNGASRFIYKKHTQVSKYKQEKK